MIAIKTDIVEDCVDINLMLDEKYRDYDVVGSGMYSYVLRRGNEGTVVKVADGNDKGYRAWVETVLYMGNTDINPYLPKIYSATHFRYHDNSNHYDTSSMLYDKEAGFTTIDKLVVEMEALEPIVVYAENGQQFSYGRHLEHIVRHDLPVKNYRKEKQNLFELLKMAKNYQGDHFLDLHHGNYMRRGRQIVITDPFS